MGEDAHLSGGKSVGLAGRIPHQWRSVVIRTSSIVMIQYGVLVVNSRGQVCLRGSRDVILVVRSS